MRRKCLFTGVTAFVLLAAGAAAAGEPAVACSGSAACGCGDCGLAGPCGCDETCCGACGCCGGHTCACKQRLLDYAQFNCSCRGSYKYPVPPLYTYHWPGMYSQRTMTEYISPWRFPPLQPLQREARPAMPEAQPLDPLTTDRQDGSVRQVSELRFLPSRIGR